jgi:hypothetical protein
LEIRSLVAIYPVVGHDIVDGGGTVAVFVHVTSEERQNVSGPWRRGTLPPPRKSFNLAEVRSTVWQ